MKTNPAARILVRVRLLLLCASLAGILGLEFYGSTFLAASIGQTTALTTAYPAPPNMNFGDVMSALR